MTAFCKVDIGMKVDAIPPEALTLRQTSGQHDRGRYLYADTISDREIANIRLYEISQDYAAVILQQLPRSLLDMETPSVYQMDISIDTPSARCLPPHIDRGRRCAINFYTKCSDEETIFYKDDGESLSRLASFHAKQNETWVLDVCQPHSVYFKSTKTRSGVTMSFRHLRFEQVVEKLKGSVC